MDAPDADPPLEARPPLLGDLVSLCRDLNREGACYVVIGGMAVIQAGFVRATNGVDLLIDTSPENQERVRRALMALSEPRRRRLDPGRQHSLREPAAAVADEADAARQGQGGPCLSRPFAREPGREGRLKSATAADRGCGCGARPASPRLPHVRVWRRDQRQLGLGRQGCLGVEAPPHSKATRDTAWRGRTNLTLAFPFVTATSEGGSIVASRAAD